jgi:hypothetical protein
MSKLDKLNILVAYPYFVKSVYKLLMEKDPSTFRIVIDSGAFTAWNTGINISLDEYCAFLDTIPSYWETKVVQLDVYGNAEKTYINYMKMLDKGYKDIMPVFTRGDTLERLEEFYSYTDYIMFGGIAIGGENRNYVKWFCEVNKGRKAHWLGFVNTTFIKHYKPYSVDSSSAINAQRFGHLCYHTGGGELKSINRKELIAKPPQVVVDTLIKLGFTHKEILMLKNQIAWVGGSIPPNNNPKGLAAFMSIVNHVHRSLEVEKNLGTKIYLAFSHAPQIQSAYDAIALLKERKVI